jgi:hypothetical protein
MPHVKVLGRFGPSDPLRVCFLVDSGVGSGQPNRRADTLLVQFFLNKVWRRAEKGESYGVPGKPPLAIDGICGNNTIAAIKRFQTIFYGGVGEAVIHDGVVHPWPAGRAVGPAHKQAYTIAALNAVFAAEYGKEKQLLLLNEPEFPGELLYGLFT